MLRLTRFICWLWLATPALAQQPLFDYQKEFPIAKFSDLKPGVRLVMTPKNAQEAHFLPKLRRVVQTPKGSRPGGLIPVEPLRNSVFTLKEFVPFTSASGREQVLAVLISNKEPYGVVIDYSLEDARKILNRMPDFINLDEFDRAKRLLEGKTIYPVKNYVRLNEGGATTARQCRQLCVLAPVCSREGGQRNA